MIHAFGQCELDDELFELRRRGKPVKLEPKIFDVLAYLVRHGERVVSKDELLDAVWPGLAVSESVLPKCIAAARRAVGDTRARPAVIRTIHGRGYRLVAEVRVHAAGEDTVAVVGSATGTPEPVVRDAAFVGRARVLERLGCVLDETRAGHGRVVLVMGEAGIGKTRTVEALAAEARRRQVTVLIGRAYEGDAAPAFWPWVQILRGCAAAPGMAALLAGGAPVAPEVVALVPELGARQADAGPPADKEARFRLFDGVATLLKRAAERQPLMLVLDDLHWADAGSLRLLGLLASEVGTSPLLIVATGRDDEVDRTGAFSELLGTLAREPACEWIALTGLDRDETRLLVDHIVASLPSELADAVHAMTGGNPFFIHEIMRLLSAEGVSGDTATISRSLPRRIRDVVRRRLATLSVDCRAVLRVASVLGREFDATVLAAIVAQSPEAVLHLLAEGRASRVLDAVGEGIGRYAFHHALIHRALYDELDDAERVGWHQRAGERIEERAGADLDAHLDEIAHHFFAAVSGGGAARAIDACARAAARADRLLAYEQSAQLYEHALAALEVAPPPDGSRRVELLLALGEARAAAGERDASRVVFERAAALARHLPRPDLFGRAVLGYRGPVDMGAPSDALTLTLLDDALAAVGQDFPALRARVLSRMAGTPPHTNRMETRSRLAREAFDLARRAGDPTALRDALSARLWASLGPDHVDERLAVARELLAFAERERSLTMTLLAYDAELGAHLLRGEMDAATRALAAFGRAAAALKQPAYLFFATFWGGSLAMARGELDAAEQAFRAAMEHGGDSVPYARFMFAGQMYPLVYLRGADDDPELARVFFGEMIELPYAFEPAIRSALAFALWLRGEREAARAELERVATRGIENLPRDEHWLTTVGSVSRVAILLGDERRAALCYDLLLPYVDLVLVHDLLRSVGEPVAAVLGHLATVLRRFDDGARHYERALAKASAMGARLALLDSKAGRARMWDARDGSGDRARAEQQRREVAVEMAALGVRRNWVLDIGEPPAEQLR